MKKYTTRNKIDKVLETMEGMSKEDKYLLAHFIIAHTFCREWKLMPLLQNGEAQKDGRTSKKPKR